MGDFCIRGYGAVCLAGCAARRGLSGLRVGRIRRSRRIRRWLGDAHLIDLNKTYTKNIDLRHIFTLYRNLAIVKEVLL
ncbi:hypothetical protein E0V34_15595 [Escherichia coli]|nr:hypothetical protein [Escherichia coli]